MQASPERAPRSRRATKVCLSLVLLGLTAWVYAPVRHYAFVNVDDPGYVTNNPDVTAGLTVRGIIRAFTEAPVSGWHPLTVLSHMLDCQLYGLSPGGHHLTNVFFHIANTLLLLMILARMTGNVWRSAFVAAVFALHPYHVESVAWVSERKDVLSTFFWMLTLLGYYRFVQRPNLRRYVVMLLAFALGLMAKPTLLMLPFTLPLLDFWPLGRMTLAGWRVKATGQKSVAGLLLEKVPLLVLAIPVSAVNAWKQFYMGGADFPFPFRVARALVGYSTYLSKTIWPRHMAMFYTVQRPLPAWQVAGSALLLIGLSLYFLRGARRYPALLVGWLWFVGILAPLMAVERGGSITMANRLMADRFMYVPIIGLAIIAAWGIPELLHRWRHRNTACAVAATLAVAVCAVLTSRQLEFWRDSTSLYQHALDVTDENYQAHFVIGWSWLEEGQLDEAFPHLAEALRIKPDFPDAHYQMGRLLAKRGSLEAAKQHYVAALEAAPAYAEAHAALGVVLAAQGDIDGAVAHYREAIRLDPNAAAPHNNLAIALENTGHADEAILQYAEGVRLEPQRAESHCNLAAALASAGRPAEAVEQFRTALQLKPQLVEARFGLASAYAQAGQVREAIADLDALLRERPDAPAVEVTLAWLLATADDASLRDGRRALELAADADRRTDHDNADVLNALAAAYAEAGRFTEAIDTAEHALAVARRNGQKALLNALPSRLTQYRAGQPVRERPGGKHQ